MRAVIRYRPLQTLMARLACLAVVLMLAAPLLSRALQSASMPVLSEVCTTAGLTLMDTAMLAMPADHAMSKVSDGEHVLHADGAACDYCLLAVRLLPLLALLLAWLPLARGVLSTAVASIHRINLRAWPAHPARGPPLAA